MLAPVPQKDKLPHLRWRTGWEQVGDGRRSVSMRHREMPEGRGPSLSPGGVVGWWLWGGEVGEAGPGPTCVE